MYVLKLLLGGVGRCQEWKYRDRDQLRGWWQLREDSGAMEMIEWHILENAKDSTKKLPELIDEFN